MGAMSIFSIIVIVFVGVYLYLIVFQSTRGYSKKLSTPIFYTFLFLIILCNSNHFTIHNFSQSTSARTIAFCTLVLFGLLITARQMFRLAQKKTFHIAICVLLVSTLLYVEYYNGIFTFEDPDEFRTHLYELKKHQVVFPMKVVSVQKDVHLVDHADFTVYLYPGLFGTPVRVENGKYYYYVPRSIGKPGQWWEYGRPVGDQL